MSLPEDKLEEAAKLIREVQSDDELPTDTRKELASARNSVNTAKTTIGRWRNFVDDSEVVDE